MNALPAFSGLPAATPNQYASKGPGSVADAEYRDLQRVKDEAARRAEEEQREREVVAARDAREIVLPLFARYVRGLYEAASPPLHGAPLSLGKAGAVLGGVGTFGYALHRGRSVVEILVLAVVGGAIGGLGGYVVGCVGRDVGASFGRALVAESPPYDLELRLGQELGGDGQRLADARRAWGRFAVDFNVQNPTFGGAFRSGAAHVAAAMAQEPALGAWPSAPRGV